MTIILTVLAIGIPITLMICHTLAKEAQELQDDTYESLTSDPVTLTSKNLTHLSERKNYQEKFSS